ncbi:MAG: hypothetical protein ACRD2G_18500, partial [Terriglobia bacterium]
MPKREAANKTAMKKPAHELPGQRHGKPDGAGSQIAVKPTALPKSLVQLLPYQIRWVEDDSPLKVVVKARQTGYSFSS